MIKGIIMQLCCMLTIKGVYKYYTNKTALTNINLTIEPGKIYGLLGPNGAGKTSLIRILNLITAPDEGTVFFKDEPLQRKHLAHFGYMPEERGLYKKSNVLEQTLYFARLKGISEKDAKERVKDWFTRLGMAEWIKKNVEELSKGMQQKVQFVMTVLHEPEIIILDEPFSGFDPVNAEQIKQEILRLKASGKTIILSTHRMESVEELCDDIALIHQSNLVLSGSVVEVKKRYHHGLIILTLEGAPLASLPHCHILQITAKSDETEYQLKLDDGITINQFLAQVLPLANVKTFSEHMPTIKEIFIETVGGTDEA